MRRIIMFDLDGTLIDSVGGIANSVNVTRRQFGFGPLPEEKIASFTGDGARKLLERSFADVSLPCPVEEAVKKMVANYAADPLHGTNLYPGVAEGLRQLAEAGFLLAVVSNKPQEVGEKILSGLGVSSLLCGNIGSALQFVTECAIAVRPLEVIVVVHTQVAVAVLKCRVGEVEVGIEDTSRDTSTSIGLRQVGASVEACRIHLPGGDIHCRARHTFSLDTGDGVVVRQFGYLVQRNIDNVDTPYAIDESTSVPFKELACVAFHSQRRQCIDVPHSFPGFPFRVEDNVFQMRRHLVCT